MPKLTISILCLFIFVNAVTPFGITSNKQWRRPLQEKLLPNTKLYAVDNQNGDHDDTSDDGGGSSYQSSASVTKGIVSSLTSLTNSIFQGTSDVSSKLTNNESSLPPASSIRTPPPTSPQELLSRIRKEYIQNNYLWTGNLDTSSFVSNCKFTDPTLSFVGVDKYVENVGNLVPVVNFLLGEEQVSRSELLSIKLNDEEKYIETRWNMVGELNTLFWRPKIDVIGRTKFWYQEESMMQEEGVESETAAAAVQVYFYDEMWEIPAGLALLQLVTKAGTIANTVQVGTRTKS